MAQLTAQQRRYIRKHTKDHELDPSETSEELNIVPFLDIVVNLIMFLLMSISAVAFFSQVEASLPEYSRGGVGRRSAEPSLNLNLTITNRGVIVSGSGGKLSPGCVNTSTGRVLTVVKRPNGEHDWNALTACAAKVKENFPDEFRVTVSADPVVEYQDVISAMDAVRSKGDKELFPEVLLSAGVR